jgi:hypothetical protein
MQLSQCAATKHSHRAMDSRAKQRRILSTSESLWESASRSYSWLAAGQLRWPCRKRLPPIRAGLNLRLPSSM